MKKKITSVSFVVLIYFIGIGVDGQLFKIQSPSASMSNLYEKLRHGFNNLIHLPERLTQSAPRHKPPYMFHQQIAESAHQNIKIYEIWPEDRRPQSTNNNKGNSDSFKTHQTNLNYNTADKTPPTRPQSPTQSYPNNIQNQLQALDNSGGSSAALSHNYQRHPYGYFVRNNAYGHPHPAPRPYQIIQPAYNPVHAPYGHHYLAPAAPYRNVQYIPATNAWVPIDNGHNFRPASGYPPSGQPGPGSTNPNLPNDPIPSAQPSSSTNRPFQPQPLSNNNNNDFNNNNFINNDFNPSSNNNNNFNNNGNNNNSGVNNDNNNIQTSTSSPNGFPTPSSNGLIFPQSEFTNCTVQIPHLFLPSTYNPVMIGHREPNPENHTLSYSHDRDIDLDISTHYDRSMENHIHHHPHHYNYKHPSLSRLPNSTHTGKTNTILLTSKVLRTPILAAPIGEGMTRAITQRDNLIRNIPIENPFETQLQALGMFFKQLENFERDRPPSTLPSIQGKVEAPVVLLTNHEFKIREPDSSEKAILDSYYNFGLSTQKIIFGDVNNLIRTWAKYSDDPEFVDPNQVGRTAEEVQNNVLKTIMKTMQMTKEYADETFEPAKDILRSSHGFDQFSGPPPLRQSDNPQECLRFGVAVGPIGDGLGGGGSGDLSDGGGVGNSPHLAGIHPPSHFGSNTACSTTAVVHVGDDKSLVKRARPSRN